MRRRRSFLDFVHDMRDAVEKAEEFTRGMDFSSFRNDERTVFAVVRALEVIGEAAKRVPRSVQARYPEVPWRDMVDMRNKVIHEYFGVDLDVVWRTVKEDLPALRESMARMVRELERGGEHG